MPMKYETILEVNDIPIDLNEFTHEFVTRIVICAVSMLKGGAEVQALVFSLQDDKPVLTINEKTVPLSAFPRDALIGTFTGMVSSLRGVHRVNKINIEMKAI
jgi:hypothetical protein